jgi:tryptophanyl-tRNA synthetase
MCGNCKDYAAQLMESFLSDLAEKRKLAKRRMEEYLVWE